MLSCMTTPATACCPPAAVALRPPQGGALPIHAAADGGFADCLRLLIAAGADVNRRDDRVRRTADPPPPGVCQGRRWLAKGPPSSQQWRLAHPCASLGRDPRRWVSLLFTKHARAATRSASKSSSTPERGCRPETTMCVWPPGPLCTFHHSVTQQHSLVPLRM